MMITNKEDLYVEFLTANTVNLESFDPKLLSDFEIAKLAIKHYKCISNLRKRELDHINLDAVSLWMKEESDEFVVRCNITDRILDAIPPEVNNIEIFEGFSKSIDKLETVKETLIISSVSDITFPNLKQVQVICLINSKKVYFPNLVDVFEIEVSSDDYWDFYDFFKGKNQIHLSKKLSSYP